MSNFVYSEKDTARLLSTMAAVAPPTIEVHVPAPVVEPRREVVRFVRHDDGVVEVVYRGDE